MTDKQGDQSKGPSMGTVLFICLTCLGLYGGYFGYCRYQVGTKVNAFVAQADTLRQRLFTVGRAINAEDVKTAVVGFVTAAGVDVDETTIKVTIEPLTAENAKKMPKSAAMGIVMNLPKHQAPKYLVGFSATISAKYGAATTRTIHRRYTYFEKVQRVPPRVKLAQPDAARDTRAEAARPDPLVLRGLSVTGLEQAELKERSDEEKRHWGKVATRTWTVRQGRQRKRVVEIQLGRRSPRSLAGYLRHWLTHRGCVAKKVLDLPPTRRGTVVPPQLTFKGRCKGGDAYIIRVLLLRDVAYELHADSFRGAEGVRASFLELLSAVGLTPTNRVTTRSK